MRQRLAVLALLALVAARLLSAQPSPALPKEADSLKFAVIGDNGTGAQPQYDISARMTEVHAIFPFEMVIMLGDNIYGRQSPQDFVSKFQQPYATLLTAGVRFYASLGNHDSPSNRSYPGFNMGGTSYYTYVKKNARFVVLDSNALD